MNGEQPLEETRGANPAGEDGDQLSSTAILSGKVAAKRPITKDLGGSL
jgi:hypothetical protein